MKTLKEFMKILCGEFDNKEQVSRHRQEGDIAFPEAHHINTICNDNMINLPDDFAGYFLLEESYYTIQEKTNSMPHLFLFTEEGENIKLESYEIPEPYTKEDFAFEKLEEAMDYKTIKRSQKFQPLLYKEQEPGVYFGECISEFAPGLHFILKEIISRDMLSVSEQFERNGVRTFGFDEPILYKRI